MMYRLLRLSFALPLFNPGRGLNRERGGSRSRSRDLGMRSSAGGLISMTPCLKVTDTTIRCDIHGDSCGHLSMQSLVERQD